MPASRTAGPLRDAAGVQDLPEEPDQAGIPSIRAYKERVRLAHKQQVAGTRDSSLPDGVGTVVDNDPPMVVQGDAEERGPVNFAEQAAGAVILAKNAGAKGSKNLLTDDEDKYCMSPCGEQKFVVIGLSEDCIVQSLTLTNHERYSSGVRDFLVLGSQAYPTKEWMVLGNFTALDQGGEQVFAMQTRKVWARYIKLVWKSHYRNEYYCTMSQIKVHGQTIMQDLHEAVSGSALTVGSPSAQTATESPSVSTPVGDLGVVDPQASHAPGPEPTHDASSTRRAEAREAPTANATRGDAEEARLQAQPSTARGTVEAAGCSTSSPGERRGDPPTHQEVSVQADTHFVQGARNCSFPQSALYDVSASCRSVLLQGGRHTDWVWCRALLGPARAPVPEQPKPPHRTASWLDRMMRDEAAAAMLNRSAAWSVVRRAGLASEGDSSSLAAAEEPAQHPTQAPAALQHTCPAATYSMYAATVCWHELDAAVSHERFAGKQPSPSVFANVTSEADDAAPAPVASVRRVDAEQGPSLEHASPAPGVPANEGNTAVTSTPSRQHATNERGTVVPTPSANLDVSAEPSSPQPLDSAGNGSHSPDPHSAEQSRPASSPAKDGEKPSQGEEGETRADSKAGLEAQQPPAADPNASNSSAAVLLAAVEPGGVAVSEASGAVLPAEAVVPVLTSLSPISTKGSPAQSLFKQLHSQVHDLALQQHALDAYLEDFRAAYDKVIKGLKVRLDTSTASAAEATAARAALEAKVAACHTNSSRLQAQLDALQANLTLAALSGTAAQHQSGVLKSSRAPSWLAAAVQAAKAELHISSDELVLLCALAAAASAVVSIASLLCVCLCSRVPRTPA